MRIAYITPYKGPSLLERRPCTGNLSLSNKVKIEQISQALRALGHDLEIISEGEPFLYQNKYYPGFQEPKGFHPDIPIHYASSFSARYLKGFWCKWQMVRLFQALHRRLPFDLVISFNMLPGHNSCAAYAARRLGLPVILEYEDDVFVNVFGQNIPGLRARFYQNACRRTLRLISGGIAVSPHLSSQFRAGIPKLLLRGTVGADIADADCLPDEAKKNWIVYSGTHINSNGIEQLIQGYSRLKPVGWELHITGHGGNTEELKKLAAPISGIVFHGLVSRQELVSLLRSARICINPADVSMTPGNVFPFKIIEYLAAGAHVVSTPLGVLEKDIECGISYIPNNEPDTIAAGLDQSIRERRWDINVSESITATYGPEALAKSLNELLAQVMARSG